MPPPKPGEGTNEQQAGIIGQHERGGQVADYEDGERDEADDTHIGPPEPGKRHQ